MLNPEKLLGGLLRGSSRSSGMFGKLGAGTVGLGLLGVAMAAAEHYMDKSRASQSTGAPPVPPGGFRSTPPPVQATAVSPPPSPAPPSAGPSVPPPPPPAGGAAPVQAPDDAVLLIRAMIAAANADGMIDAQERGRILEKLKAVDLTPEEQSFIVQELLSPCDLDAIAIAVKTPEIAKQVYAVSLMAIEVDTDAEREYIRKLAEGLGLDEAARGKIHRELGIDHV